MWPFSQKLKYFKRYKKLVADYVAEPIECPDEFKHDLEHIREFLWGCEANAFVCGGFASAVAGFTKEYGDVDIYCINEGVYNALVEKMAEVGEVQHVKFEGNLTKGFIRGDVKGDEVKIDLIYRNGYSNIEDLVEVFDINWSMFGIDLMAWEVVYHPDAMLRELFLNRDVDIGNSLEDMDICQQLTERRINKYSHRRSTPVELEDIMEEYRIHLRQKEKAEARKHAY